MVLSVPLSDDVVCTCMGYLYVDTVPLPLYQPTLISTLGKYALFIVMLG